MGHQWSHENYYVCRAVIALEINRAGADVWFRGEKATTGALITNWTLTHIPLSHRSLPKTGWLPNHSTVLAKAAGSLNKAGQTHKMTHYLPHKLWDHSQKYKRTFSVSGCQLDKASQKYGNMVESRRKTLRFKIKHSRGWRWVLSRWWEKQIMCEASSRRNHGTRASMANLWQRMGLWCVLAVMSAYTADRFMVGHSNKERWPFFCFFFF